MYSQTQLAMRLHRPQRLWLLLSLLHEGRAIIFPGNELGQIRVYNVHEWLQAGRTGHGTGQ